MNEVTSSTVNDASIAASPVLEADWAVKLLNQVWRHFQFKDGITALRFHHNIQSKSSELLLDFFFGQLPLKEWYDTKLLEVGERIWQKQLKTRNLSSTESSFTWRTGWNIWKSSVIVTVPNPNGLLGGARLTQTWEQTGISFTEASAPSAVLTRVWTPVFKFGYFKRKESTYHTLQIENGFILLQFNTLQVHMNRVQKLQNCLAFLGRPILKIHYIGTSDAMFLDDVISLRKF